MDFGLKGKTAVVTGGSKGIGYGTAKAFLEEGAQVVICARNEDELNRTVKELSGLGKIVGVKADMTSAEEAGAVAETAWDIFGSLDCWVNNVGASFLKEGEEYDGEQIDRTVHICFSSVIYGTQAAFRYMKETGGAIVNISSLAARCGTVGASTLYGPLKAAVNRLAVSFAGEYAAYGIRVNSVMPGFTMTPAVKATIAPEYLERNVRDTLLRRAAEAEEIAAPILFLCSRGASYITGACLDVTGGRGIVLNPEYSYEQRKMKMKED